MGEARMAGGSLHMRKSLDSDCKKTTGYGCNQRIDFTQRRRDAEGARINGGTRMYGWLYPELHTKTDIDRRVVFTPEFKGLTDVPLRATYPE